MSYLLSSSFLMIFLTLFSQLSKDLIPYGLDLPDRVLRQVAILSESLLDLLDLVYLCLVLPFIMANFNL
jgi:hypothetical protein